MQSFIELTTSLEEIKPTADSTEVDAGSGGDILPVPASPPKSEPKWLTPDIEPEWLPVDDPFTLD